MFWFFSQEVCGILVPQPGLEPTAPALEGKVFTGPPGKSLIKNPLSFHSLSALLWLLWWLSGKESHGNAGDRGDSGDSGSIPGLGKSPGGGDGNPLQYSCLGNSMDRDAGRLQSTGFQRVGNDWERWTALNIMICGPITQFLWDTTCVKRAISRSAKY